MTAGVEWPARESLDETQWWPPERLRRGQFRQLARVLHFAAHAVPFYRERLSQFATEEPAELSEEAWARIPILTRAEVLEHQAALRSSHLPRGHSPRIPLRSSGSTGRPVSVESTALAASLQEALRRRSHGWHGRDLRETMCLVTDPALSHPGPSLLVLDFASPAATVAEWLLTRECRCVVLFPSNLELLLHHLRETGLRLPRLRSVATFGEMVTPALRRLQAEVLGVPLADTYGAQELGMLAQECPEHGGYHLQSESVLLEVLDESGRPCREGQEGRVVVTALHNFATPLVRYELGDLAVPGPPCPCGRGLPVLAEIRGRLLDRVVMPGGELRVPHRLDRLTEVAPLRQYQVVQRGLEQLQLLVAPLRPLTAAERQALADRARELLGSHFKVAVEELDVLPRRPGGKLGTFRQLQMQGGQLDGQSQHV